MLLEMNKFRIVACILSVLLVWQYFFSSLEYRQPLSIQNYRSINNSGLNNMTSIDSTNKLIFLFDPLEANFAIKRGGLGQWFHVAERVITRFTSQEHKLLLERLAANISGMARPTIILLFHEKLQVRDHLTPFTRLMLSTLFTHSGEPLFSTIAFGYIDLNPRRSWADCAISILQAVGSSRIVFATNIYSQSSYELFRKSFDVNLPIFSMQNIHTSQVISMSLPKTPIPTFEWFNANVDEYLVFRKSVSGICLDNSLYPILNMHTISGGEASADDLAPSDEKIRMSLVRGMYSFEHKIYNTAWKNRNRGAFLERSIIEVERSPRKVLMYQRDRTRSIVNLEDVVNRLRGRLSNESNWTIEVVYHNEQQAPCILLDIIAKSTAIITSHGFQSTLLLFQPLNSVLAEVHPRHAFSPEFYGFIQAGFRYNFKAGRSYLTEESLAVDSNTDFVISKVLKPLFDSERNTNNEVCRSGICMSVAKVQNVVISTAFLNRTIEYLLEHFR